MQIPSAQQIRQLDADTIAYEPIASIELMERAAHGFVRCFIRHYGPELEAPIAIFCGVGNNGGDGLAIARLLHEAAYTVQVYLAQVSPTPSPDFCTNLARLRDKRVIATIVLDEGDALPTLSPGTIIIDALFGVGLNRPILGYWAALIEHLNAQPATRLALDLPSGLRADAPSSGAIIRADRTFTFGLPKLALLLSQNNAYVGTWEVIPIGLHPAALQALTTPYHILESAALRTLLHHRQRFDHKGTYGHALIVAGSYGKMGAAILASRATLRAGAGLVTVHAPRCGYEILQIAFPEAMVNVDPHKFACSQVCDVAAYQSVGLGPGLGTNEVTAAALRELLPRLHVPVVVDADALNLLARDPALLKQLPPQSILTPHPREFERLFGRSDDDFARLQLLREQAQQHQLIIVLKMGITAIAHPDGQVSFNTTGNPGMGTAGTGDVLTGMITGLLAQGYAPLAAAQLGVYLHGLAGDLAADQLEQESLLAEDVIRYLGAAFRRLKQR